MCESVTMAIAATPEPDAVSSSPMSTQPLVYIDFEGRKEKPPVLLGELWKNGDGEEFAQSISDEQLQTARVARRHVTVDALDVVVRRLLERARRENRLIVAWSNHEKEMIRKFAGLTDPELSELDSRYVNAIQPARLWRRALMPKWLPEGETLKGYFAATAFQPTLSQRVSREPARWIEHTQGRIAATGSYRKVGTTVKRDWQNLLTYNEDDCRGLCHVYEVTTRERTLWKAYTETTFVVAGERGLVEIRVGQHGRRLRRLLEHHKALTWAFISAWNPSSNALPPAENAARHHALVKAVRDAGFSLLSGRGIPADSSWPPEESLMVFDISEQKAVSLGRTFGQLAIVWGRRDGAAQLLSCRAVPAVLLAASGD
jgi:hypothetical protein